jgi:glutaredoxin 3
MAYDRKMVEIFGKDTCPYTQAARDHYVGLGVPFKYHNVKKQPAELERMLAFSKGRREVPVIVEGTKVTIGYGGT